jgi:hypothetical protein
MVFDQDVTLGEQGDQNIAQRRLGNLDRQGHVPPDPVSQRCYIRGFELVGRVHLSSRCYAGAGVAPPG